MEELYSGHDWQITLETSPETPAGKTRTSARASTSDTVSIIAFSEEDTILLLREYRPYWKCWVWMLPSGKVDKEADHREAAQRELQEETGYRAETMEKYISAEYAERMKFSAHIYVASDLEQDPLPQDEDELMEVHAVSYDEAVQKVLNSDHVHLVSAYALMRYQKERL